MINPPLEYYNEKTGGAISTVIRELTFELTSFGHHVSVYSPADSNPPYREGQFVKLEDTTASDKSQVSRLYAKLWRLWYRWDHPRYWYYVRSVVKLLKETKHDVIVIHSDYGLAYHLRKNLGPQPIILNYIHNDPRSGFRYLDKSVQATDGFCAVSSYIAKRIDAQLRAGCKTSVAINGVNLSRFSPSGERKLTGSEPFRALFVGRINSEKAPDVALDAVKRLRSQGLDVTLDIAGAVWWHGRPIDSDPYAAALVAELVPPTGQFLGDVSRNRMPETMRNYDALIVPSKWQDPCPLVVAEGLASGCIVFGSNRGGIPEVLENPDVIFDPDDSFDLCNKLARVITDGEYREALKVKLLERAQTLSWKRTARQFEDIVLRAKRSKQESDRATVS